MRIFSLATTAVVLLSCFAGSVQAYVDPAFDRGKQLMATQEWDAAATAFGESLGLNSTDSKALTLRGECFYKMGNYKFAIDDLNNSILYAPNNLKALLLRGTCHSILGHDAMAIIDYEAAIRMDPNLAKKFYAAGGGGLQVQEVPHAELGTKADSTAHAHAVQDYKDAMHNVYPNGFIAAGNPDTAVSSDGQTWSGNVGPNGNRTLVASSQPGSVGAEQAVAVPGKAGTGMTNNNNGMPYINSDAQNNAGMESSDTISASKDKRFVTNLDQDPNRGEIGALAGTGVFQGDAKKAIIDYNQALGLDPTNGEYYFRRAKAYQKLEKVNEAMGDFEHAISQSPNQARFYLGRASLFYQLGKTILLQADIESARNCDPDLPAKIHFNVPPLPAGVRWAGDGAN